jgi:hypothetical protein
MKDWIAENINPPGIKTQNRGSLFSTIGKIFGIVRDDATTAFNAHFPYLADAQKLARHGESLSIPLLKHDTERDYRERVATASFYLMRAGERAYIHEQLTTHFGSDHYMIWDDFLRIYVKILDPSDDDRVWAYSLLDRIVNPNVALTAIDWFQFIDNIEIKYNQTMTLRRAEHDVYTDDLRCDGRILCDQGIEILCDGTWLCNGAVTCERFIAVLGTVYNTITIAETCNGTRLCDGAIDCSGYSSLGALGDISLPLLSPKHLIDRLNPEIGLALNDRAKVYLLCDGKWLCDGSNQQSFIDAWAMPIEISPRHEDQADITDGGQDVAIARQERDRYRLLCNGEVLCNQGWDMRCDGSWLCDGSVSCARFIAKNEEKTYADMSVAHLALVPMEDSARVNALCDGSILCDGSNQKSFVDAPMALRLVKHYWCDGRREVSCTPSDGSFLCDGSRTCFDNGWYCAGNIVLEEEAA